MFLHDVQNIEFIEVQKNPKSPINLLHNEL